MSFMKVMLPLGISFYTFQQIPYLVAAYNREFHDIGLLKYCVVNSFFPHLIAGPIIWHREIAPQLVRGRDEPIDTAMATLGLVFFSIGLFKKVILADNIVYMADDVFDAAAAHAALTFGDGWLGAIAYGLQIYFDFSGYSEMAIGLALLFGIRFPINFFSPYKATSVIEFWRRWHMTMTRFFQEFVYVPLQFAVGRRFRSAASRYGVIMIMMLLVGLWHGAGWTWIFWGIVHGLLLCWNHLWRSIRKTIGLPYEAGRSISLIGRTLSWALTFLSVSAAWVLFRAADSGIAASIYRSMFFLNGFVLPKSLGAMLPSNLYNIANSLGAVFADGSLSATVSAKISSFQIIGLGALLVFVALAPNTLQILRYYSEGRTLRAFNSAADSVADFDWTNMVRQWRPTWGWVAAAAAMFIVSLTSIADDTSRTVFIYFNF
jgi:alginate O-acetyltransferase complex protein AlgI